MRGVLPFCKKIEKEGGHSIEEGIERIRQVKYLPRDTEEGEEPI